MKKELTKKCNWCNIEKSLSDFYWDKANSHYLYICRKCDNKKNEENKKKRGHYTSNRFKAKYAVKTAVGKGNLIKLPCEVCGIKKVQGHHYKGYAEENWLEVKWLCQLHHNLEHHPIIK